MIKKTIIFTLGLLTMASCTIRDTSEYRLPFKINRNLSCEFLIASGYERIWGDDVFLIGKEIGDTAVYYQIEFPTQYDTSEVQEIGEDIYPTDSITLINEIRNICKNGTIYWRIYELKLDSISALTAMDNFDENRYEIIPVELVHEELYFINVYKVINLIDKDTFDCAIIKRDENWILQSSIMITNN